uniref:Uncharacterized protein n=1 Tax=Arundo donax TaxID=35708 RepID=A0A0A9DMM8_ARUDO
MPSSGGIGPVRELEERSITSTETRPPIAGGITSDRPYPDRLRPVTMLSPGRHVMPCHEHTSDSGDQPERTPSGSVRLDFSCSRVAGVVAAGVAEHTGATRMQNSRDRSARTSRMKLLCLLAIAKMVPCN